MLLKGALYFIDYALTVSEEGDPSDYDAASHWINQAFGSANP